MDVRIVSVQEHGDLEKEHIVLAADAQTNLWNYILSDSTYHGDGSTSNKHRHVFDFDELSAITLNKGDLVLLYTKIGKFGIQKLQNGSKAYFIYWGLDETVWNKDGDEAVLVKVEERSKKKV
ncbi:hypothetical protein R0H17_25230 [Phytobacter diazotrophicus]|uniref:hypothetical protein n=1 Tax=Phytobacter diazotrophicus TaxID=395631 RepID=UPI0029359822|nr:hypothetical protein [Phytobacter diazotrophicus]MDV2904928.1 hypothetical protein [Phytobacter diazotrophicus]